MTRRNKVIISFCLLFIILVSCFILFGGSYLVKSHSNSQPGFAFILMSDGTPDRPLATNELFKKNKINKVFFVETFRQQDRLLDSLGIPNFTPSDQFKLIIQKLGIPDSLVAEIPGPANCTRDEAKFALEFLCKDSSIHNLTIITSSYHTRRAYWIFKKQLSRLNCNIEISMASNPYTEFKAKGWWKDRESSKIVFMEWMKIIHFLCWERWRE